MPETISSETLKQAAVSAEEGGEIQDIGEIFITIPDDAEVMERRFRRAISLLVVAFIIAVIGIIAYSGLAQDSVHAEEGTLTGMVTIGPLCPVEPCTIPDDQVREIYAARRVLAYHADGAISVAEIVPEPGRDYRITLAPGTYIIDINHLGIDSSSDVPAEVSIAPGQTVRLDIAIDTGIR